MIRLEGVTLSAGGRELLRGVDWHVRPGERVALVGRNGSGKSTLMRLLVGEGEADEGRVWRRSGLRLGWLPQEGVSGSSETVWEEARSGMTTLLALEARREACRASVDGSEASVAALADAEDAWRLAGGYAWQEKVGQVLHGLGFAQEDWHRTCDTFSGGWQVRIALARLLLSDPELLLLDEPTNHLDLHARGWLAEFLASHKGSVVVVSHDRHLLDRCATAVAEVRHGRLVRTKGNLSRWRELRTLADAELLAAQEKQQAEAAQAQGLQRRFGAKANKARMVKSRLKRLAHTEVVTIERDAPPPRLVLPEPEPGREQLVGLREADLGYGDTVVLRGVDLVLRPGERWVVLGPNGAGKTTLLDALAGRRVPLSGRRETGRGVRTATFAQDQARELNPENSAVEAVLARCPFVTEARARKVLGSLGLGGDQALQPVGTLSGGERVRVSLACLALSGAELLFLDEPTNHLDIVTAEVLEEALAAWTGTLVVVSHDRALVKRLATHVARVGEGRVEHHPGLREEDLEPGGRFRAATREDAARERDGERDWRAIKAAKRARERAERRLVALERSIAEREEALEAVDEALAGQAGDPVAVAELLSERQALSEALDVELAEWEEVGASLED